MGLSLWSHLPTYVGPHTPSITLGDQQLTYLPMPVCLPCCAVPALLCCTTAGVAMSGAMEETGAMEAADMTGEATAEGESFWS